MPPKNKKKDCLVMLVNVGCTDETENLHETSFLEKSKTVMKLLIQRKIFLRPKDEVGIIIMGAPKTKNRLSFDNIEEINSMQIPTWDLVEKVTNLQGTNVKANWVDGINVVLNYVNTECVERNVTRTVVLLTDFKEDPDVIEQYDINTIVADINSQEINLLAIHSKSLNVDSQIGLNPSESLFASVCKMVQGETMTFDETIPKLMIYKDQSKKPMPWKVDMDLFDINIPVVVYLKTTDDFKLPKWQLFTETDAAKVPIERTRALVDKEKHEISRSDIITGNMFGRKFIPFSDEDKAALKYNGGPKGFTIYGFTKRQFITMDCLAGKGSYIVVPQEGFASPFYSLIKAMADSNKVAIVRRVYQVNTAPKMGVLFPQLDVPGNPWCLVYIELVFAEDRRVLQVKPLTSTMNDLSDEQEYAIDKLIDSMMLTEVEDDTTGEVNEAFQAGTVCDASRQYMWDKLTHRALHPNEPLPPMSDFLNQFFEPPKSVQRKSKPVLKSIKTLFPIKPVIKKKFVRRTPKQDSNPPDEDIEDVQQLTDAPDLMPEEPDVENITQHMETEDEALYRIAESVEMASQSMDVDLDELAKSM